MQTPEQVAVAVLGRLCSFPDPSAPEWCVNHDWDRDENASNCDVFIRAVDLIRARDAEVRADERGRCSVIHATLTDQELVDELVRRGVFQEETRRLADGMAYATLDREGVVHTGGRPQTRQRRYVGPWETLG